MHYTFFSPTYGQADITTFNQNNCTFSCSVIIINLNKTENVVEKYVDDTFTNKNKTSFPFTFTHHLANLNTVER